MRHIVLSLATVAALVAPAGARAQDGYPYPGYGPTTPVYITSGDDPTYYQVPLPPPSTEFPAPAPRPIEAGDEVIVADPWSSSGFVVVVRNFDDLTGQPPIGFTDLIQYLQLSNRTIAKPNGARARVTDVRELRTRAAGPFDSTEVWCRVQFAGWGNGWVLSDKVQRIGSP